MPYKSTKIIIAGTKYDRRVKLLKEQKLEILELKGTITQKLCAEMYNVSRSTIRFIWNPEALLENQKRREERGGSSIYHNRKKLTDATRSLRRYKNELYKQGKIKLKD